jgi:hypothetical protein
MLIAMLIALQTAEKTWSATWISALAAWVALGFLGLVGVAILYYVFTGRMDLSGLISEPNGEASMSRFQLLIFTFVIAACLFLIVASKGPPDFPKDIPQGILVLLGISSSSYLVSKGIQASSKQGLGGSDPSMIISGSRTTTTAGGDTIQFQAQVDGLTSDEVTWSLDPATGLGTISTTGLYTPPPKEKAEDVKGKKVVINAASKKDLSLKDSETIELT